MLSNKFAAANRQSWRTGIRNACERIGRFKWSKHRRHACLSVRRRSYDAYVGVGGRRRIHGHVWCWNRAKVIYQNCYAICIRCTSRAYNKRCMPLISMSTICTNVSSACANWLPIRVISLNNITYWESIASGITFVMSIIVNFKFPRTSPKLYDRNSVPVASRLIELHPNKLKIIIGPRKLLARIKSLRVIKLFQHSQLKANTLDHTESSGDVRICWLSEFGGIC